MKLLRFIIVIINTILDVKIYNFCDKYITHEQGVVSGVPINISATLLIGILVIIVLMYLLSYIEKDIIRGYQL